MLRFKMRTCSVCSISGLYIEYLAIFISLVQIILANRVVLLLLVVAEELAAEMRADLKAYWPIIRINNCCVCLLY